MTPRNRQRPRPTDERDDWDDDPGMTVDVRPQGAAGSGVAERHRRTSKHRAPKQKGKPPQRRPRHEAAAKSKPKESPSRKQASLVQRISPDFFTKRIIRIIWVIFCTVAFVGIFVFLYFFFAGSRFFALRDVEIVGNKLLQREFIESIARGSAKEGVLKADLNKIREELKQRGIVKSVEITRMLPDMIRIVIEEREPYALARRGDSRAESSVVCVDKEGVMFGDQTFCKSKSGMPLVNGLEESGDRATERNQKRLAVYHKLLTDLDAAEPRLSSRIEEVYFDNELGVRVTIEAPDKEGAIAVFLGNEEFRIRLNAALDVLDAIYRQDAEALNVLRIGDAEKLLSGARISYLNATTPKRVVVGLEE